MSAPRPIIFDPNPAMSWNTVGADIILLHEFLGGDPVHEPGFRAMLEGVLAGFVGQEDGDSG